MHVLKWQRVEISRSYSFLCTATFLIKILLFQHIRVILSFFISMCFKTIRCSAILLSAWGWVHLSIWSGFTLQFGKMIAVQFLSHMLYFLCMRGFLLLSFLFFSWFFYLLCYHTRLQWWILLYPATKNSNFHIAFIQFLSIFYFPFIKRNWTLYVKCYFLVLALNTMKV